MPKLRMGMVGGGPGAFIGPLHRIAAELDGEIELVAGAFSRDTARSREAGVRYGIDPARAYADVDAMVTAEQGRSDGIDFVAIVSPNNHHLPAACAALAADFPVLSDKPATATLDEAHMLRDHVGRAGLPYGLTYTYSGYPMIREARARVAAGALGAVRKIVVEYPQDWLAAAADSKQAAWRLDPAQAGEGGCIGDIGIHAFHLAEFVSGLRVTEILADLGSVVPGRVLDDDCTIALRFDNGARGLLSASQISVGERNGLRLRIYGDRGGLDWAQESPNRLTLHELGNGTRLIERGDPGLGFDAKNATRTPGGHPEGYIEAFANLYRDFARTLRCEEGSLVPGIEEGLRGMAFVARAVSASRDGLGWVKLEV